MMPGNKQPSFCLFLQLLFNVLLITHFRACERGSPWHTMAPRSGHSLIGAGGEHTDRSSCPDEVLIHLRRALLGFTRSINIPYGYIQHARITAAAASVYSSVFWLLFSLRETTPRAQNMAQPSSSVYSTPRHRRQTKKKRPTLFSPSVQRPV